MVRSSSRSRLGPRSSTTTARADAGSTPPDAPPSDPNDKERLMPAHKTRSGLNVESVETWLVEKLADRLELPTSEIDVDSYFDEFDLDPSEAPIPVGKLTSWLGFELDKTALWCHPTIASLAQHIVEEIAARTTREPSRGVRARLA
jgi:acyl carrier protein